MITQNLKERKKRWNRIKLKQKYNIFRKYKYKYKFRKTKPNFWLSETLGGACYPAPF